MSSTHSHECLFLRKGFRLPLQLLWKPLVLQDKHQSGERYTLKQVCAIRWVKSQRKKSAIFYISCLCSPLTSVSSGLAYSSVPLTSTVASVKPCCVSNVSSLWNTKPQNLLRTSRDLVHGPLTLAYFNLCKLLWLQSMAQTDYLTQDWRTSVVSRGKSLLVLVSDWTAIKMLLV